MNSPPENTFLNENRPFQEKKKKSKPRKLTKISTHTAVNRQDGVHELPGAQIPKGKTQLRCIKWILEGRGKLVARTYTEGKGRWDKWE